MKKAPARDLRREGEGRKEGRERSGREREEGEGGGKGEEEGRKASWRRASRRGRAKRRLRLVQWHQQRYFHLEAGGPEQAARSRRGAWRGLGIALTLG